MKKAAPTKDQLDNQTEDKAPQALPDKENANIGSSTPTEDKGQATKKASTSKAKKVPVPEKIAEAKGSNKKKKVPAKKEAPKVTTKAKETKKSTPSRPSSDKTKSAAPAKKAKGDIKVILQLRFHTQPGQTVWITGSGLLLGDSVLKQMYYEDNEHWRLELTVTPALLKEDIRYRYHIKNTDGSFLDDYQEKILPLKNLGKPFLFIRDFWSYAGYHDNVYEKAPFDFLIKRNSGTASKPVTATTTHLFQVKVPCTRPNEGVCILGENEVLGFWDSQKFRQLAYNPMTRVWEGSFSFKDASPCIAYKYGIFDQDTQELVRLEHGENRHTFILDEKGLVIQNDGYIRLLEKHWKGAGVNIPLFSIRTSNDCGVGDMGSIKLLVDWMSSVGLKLLQLLPINDTTVSKTWKDSYPYSAISVFALHPVYIDIHQLLTPELKARPTIQQQLDKAKQLNELPQMDYEAVFHLKQKIVEEAYAVLRKETFASAGYKTFYKANEDWLKPYAAFSVLRDQHSSPDPETWGEGAATYSGQVFDHLYKTRKDAILRYFFVQYILSRQLSDAVQYAHAHQIVLKGDIPIGVDRYSVDVWQNPQLFDTQMQAGAPPDFFTQEGQNWGFPTYRWDMMEKDDYAWWKRRLTNMAQYFDAIRMDHILGFFRIWSIQADQVQGILGYFQPSIPVDESEFGKWDIPFDYDRYCTPFINDQILTDLFGDIAPYVKTQFLDHRENGMYSFKPEFDTQRKIKHLFDTYEHNAHNTWLMKTLLSLAANVIFVPDRQPGKYHCRFVFYETSSYAYLSDREKHQLYYLYLNYYFERQDDSWRKIGYRQLSAINSITDMMICGEDLGMVPRSASSVMEQLGYLGLKVQRMGSGETSAFTNPLEVGFLNVVTPSTHDMPPIRNWWDNEPSALKDVFYSTQLHCDGSAPEKCNDTIVSQVVFSHLQSPALWSIFLMQDILCMEASTTNPDMAEDIINRPEIPHFYWRYRMPLSVEKLQKEEQLNGKIKNLLQLSNR